MGCTQSSSTATSPSAAAVGGSKVKADACVTANDRTSRTTTENGSDKVTDGRGEVWSSPLQFSRVLQSRSTAHPLLSSKKNSIGKNLLIEREQNFRDVFDVVKQIGEGSISTIYLVKKRYNVADGSTASQEAATMSQQVYALKEIDVSNIEKDMQYEMRNEIGLLRALDHPNILKIFEVYDWDGKLSIVMEHCKGGDLDSRNGYTEEEARMIIVQLLNALNYLHTPTPDVVVHRDIKFGNIMFQDDRSMNIKLIDFGISTKYAKREKLKEVVGTLYTMAPELLLKEGYDTSADMWSVGVVAYQLLNNGKPPFWSDDTGTLVHLVRKGEYNFDGPQWQSVSSDAKSFVRKLLQKVPKVRMSADQALKHRWLYNLSHPDPRHFDYDYIARLYDSADAYSQLSDFEKLALQAVARKMTMEEAEQIQTAFVEMDTDHTGLVSYKEMKRFLGRLYPEGDIQKLFQNIDVDASGKINYTEFLAACMAVNGSLSIQRLREAFDTLDTDDSGRIDLDNLIQLMGEEADESYVRQVLEEGDLTGDGMISWDEFLTLFRNQRRDDAVNILVTSPPTL